MHHNLLEICRIVVFKLVVQGLGEIGVSYCVHNVVLPRTRASFASHTYFFGGGRGKNTYSQLFVNHRDSKILAEPMKLLIN